MSWKDLDIKLKAELIKLGVQSGIRDINLIRLLYDDNNTPTLVIDLSYNETNVRPLLGIERVKLEYGISEEEQNKANEIIQLIENEISLEEINNQLPVLFRQFKNGGYKNNPPFEEWYKTVPVDRNDTTYYNLRKAYEELPFDLLERWRTATLEQLNNELYHLPTVSSQSLEFLKSRNHPSIQYELDWYNSQEGKDFRDKHSLDTTGNYYRYIPKAKGGYISNNPTLALVGKVNKFNEGGYEDENKNINNSILGRYVLSKISQNNLESQELPIIIMEEPVSESTHVELPSLNIQELELLNFLLSDPTIELWYLRDLAIQNMTSPQSDLGVIQTKEEQDLVDKAFLGYDNFRYSHPWAEGLGYTPVIGDAMDLISIAGDVNNKDYMSAGVGLGMLALPNFIEKPLRYVKDFRFSPITNSTFRKKAKELSKRGERLKRFYDMDLKMYEDAASEYNKTYNRDLKDMYYNDYVEVSNLMDKEATSRGYTWAYLLNSNNPFDYTNWSAYRTYTPSLLEKTNLNHVKRYEDYNKIAQLYLSSNGEVKMVGSTLSNAKGVTNSDYLASDIDFLTTKKNAEELSKQYNLRKNMSGTAYVNKLASVAGREMELNALFIDEDPNGNAVGKLALEYFAIKNPKEYNKFVQDCIDNNKPILETPLPIKSDELFNSINEDDILLRVILDNIGSGHDKHRKRVQRSLLSVDSNTVKKYKQALDNSMESLFGENYKKFTEEFPNIKFDDVEQNKNFLKRIFGDKGYDIEAVAKDPERMEVITEMYYYSYSTSGRHTLGLDNKFEGKVVPADSGLGVSIINPKGSTGGGSVAGGGTNTGLGKAPAGYGNYESVFLLPITYDKSKINNLDDLVNQVEHITSKKSLDLSRLLGSYVGDDISYNSLDKLKHIDEVTREHDIPIVVNENSHINTGYTGVFADADVLRSAKISELDKDVAAIFETPSGMVNAKKLFEPISEFIPLDKWNNSDDLIKALNSKKDELLSKRNELLSELKLDMDNKKDLLESSAHKYDRNHREQQNLKSKFKKLQALETALYIIGGEVLVYGGTKYLTNNKKEGKEIEVNNELLETLDTIASRNYAQSLKSNFPNLAFSHKFEK